MANIFTSVALHTLLLLSLCLVFLSSVYICFAVDLFVVPLKMKWPCTSHILISEPAISERERVCVCVCLRFLLPVHRVLFNYCLCVISTVFDYLFHLCVQIKCYKLSIIYDAIDTSFFFAALLAMIMSAFLRLFCIFISFALFFGLVMVMAHRPHSFYAFNNVRSLSVLI